MKNITFNVNVLNKRYYFYASWDDNYQIKTFFSSNIDGIYNGEINLFGKNAIDFLYCINKANVINIGNKHLEQYNENCILTYKDNKRFIMNNWNFYSFPKNIDYLYTAISLCDNKFINIFKKRTC